jgi:hypothetical protein
MLSSTGRFRLTIDLGAFLLPLCILLPSYALSFVSRVLVNNIEQINLIMKFYRYLIFTAAQDKPLYFNYKLT